MFNDGTAQIIDAAEVVDDLLDIRFGEVLSKLNGGLGFLRQYVEQGLDHFHVGTSQVFLRCLIL